MTETIQKITAAAAQGLTRAEVEATVLGGRALTADEQTAFDKARGIRKLREAKRRADERAERAAQTRGDGARADALERAIGDFIEAFET